MRDISLLEILLSRPATGENRHTYETHLTRLLDELKPKNPYLHNIHVCWYDNYFLEQCGIEPIHNKVIYAIEERKKEN
jgi:hypothetical protein